MIPIIPRFSAAATAALAMLTACDRQPANPAQTASTYTSDADSDAVENAREGTRMGKSLEAPPKIPGIRVQVAALRKSANPSPENLTAYKAALADLVSSMEADLTRLGIADTLGIRAAGDSLLDDLGGGTGIAKPLSRAELGAHTAAVDRLIAQYEGAISPGKS